MKKYSNLFILTSALFYSLGGLFFKIATWSSMAISSARSIIAFILIAAFMIVIKHKFVFNRCVLFAALANTCTSILYSYANKLTTAGNTIVLQFTMPAFVIIITAIMYRSLPSKLELKTCFFVLLGIVIFFIDSLSAGNSLGNIIALASGFAYAFVFILNSKEDADPLSSMVLSLFITALIGLPELMKTDIVNSSTNVILAVVGLGVLQQGFGHILLSLGIKGAKAVTSALLSGIEPVLNPILVAVFYGEMLTPLSIVGAFIVLISIMSYNVIVAKK